ncbi:MAG: M20/M25/M40 family metallo-hydrolase [Dehalococcoidia bacterium]
MFDLEKVYRYIDDHLDEHTTKLQELLRQSSSSKTDPEGTRQCAHLVRKYLTDLGCNKVEFFESGITTYLGWPGYPVVYAEYDAHADKTLLIYLVYDTQPFEADKWISHPLEANLVDADYLGKCIVARGAVNQKGPLGAFLNAVEAVKATGQELPVNLKFVADGEREELMSPSLTRFIEERKDRLRVDAVFYPQCSQGRDNKVRMVLGYKGTYGFALECKGGEWGGPTRTNVSPSDQAWVDNPAWRLVQALCTMYDAKNHKILIEGWYDDVSLPSEEDMQLIDKLLETFEEEKAKERLGVKRFVHDLHGKELLLQYLYSTELIIYHIHAGPPGTSSLIITGLVPWKANMRMNIRLVPEQSAEKVIPMIRDHLDKHGFSDIEIVQPLGYPWSKVSVRESIVQAMIRTCREFGYEPEIWPHSTGSAPHYLFSHEDYLNVPSLAGGLGHGGCAHAPNEYFVIEGKGEIQGLAECEKSYVALLNYFAECEANHD